MWSVLKQKAFGIYFLKYVKALKKKKKNKM